jgi:cobalt-zinc-cadmium efflux system outer membrane protein
MGLRSSNWLAFALALLLGGCCYPVRDQADRTVCELAGHPLDLEPGFAADRPPAAMPPAQETQAAPQSDPLPADLAALGPIDAGVRPAAAQAPADRTEVSNPRLEFLKRLQLPAGLPGGSAAPLPDLPPSSRMNNKPREEAIARLFRPLPELGSEPRPVPGPNGRPLTLSDLQALALSKSPLIRQAAAQVQAAEGAAIQAGAYPNPNLGYQSDTVGTGATAGFQGFFLEQTIKTAGKLKLAQAAATMDLLNARLSLRRAQSDLATSVRGGYFAVLVAQENVKVSRALVTLADQVYGIQLDQLKVGLVATYEPMQLRVLAVQARAALVQARNRYVSAWKQLAAALGLPALPPTELAGRVDMDVPAYVYKDVLARVLAGHTDVLTTENGILRARYNLRLQQVTPIPDVMLHLAVEKDYSMPPFETTYSVQLGGPIPLWDQNKGNIIQAQGNLLNAIEEPHRVRDDLTTRLADAFERYSNNLILVQDYRDRILPDQVRVYRSVFERHQIEPDQVSFGDIVTAQQTLATAITTYVTTLGALWQAVADVAGLLQTNDLFQVGPVTVPHECVAPVPDLEQLTPLPCGHPCTPLPDPALKGADGNWPPAALTPATAEPSPDESPAEPAPPPRRIEPAPGAKNGSTGLVLPPSELPAAFAPPGRLGATEETSRRVDLGGPHGRDQPCRSSYQRPG